MREDLLRLFVEHTPAAVAMFDRQMRYLLVSRRFLTDYRLSEPEIIGKSHYDIFPEIRKMPHWVAVHRRCLAGATERCEEDPFPRADGSIDWVRWEVLPWRDSSGEIGGILMMTEVITEKKGTEISLRKQVNDLQKEVDGFLSEMGRPPKYKPE